MRAKPLITAVLLSMAVPMTCFAQQPAPAGNGPMPMLLQPGPDAPKALQSAPPAPGNGIIPAPEYGMPPPGSAAASWLNSGGSIPIGRDGPIGEEVYFYEGPTISAGGGRISRQIDTGWMTEFGGRALLFNPAQDGALTLSAGVSFQYNDGNGTDGAYTLYGLPVQVRNLMRWSGILAVGYDWFRQGMSPIGGPQNTLRYGVDFGGRWGDAHLDLNVNGVQNDPFHVNDYLKHSSVYGGIELAAHADIEVPMRSWVLVGGIRTEWAYNWSAVGQTVNSTVVDINILFTCGFRY
jgi:hypothetical protein